MRIATTLVIMCCCLALFAACKKGTDNKDLSPIGKLLVAGKWQLSAHTATTNYMGKDTTLDLYAIEDQCDKDDFVLFGPDGTGTVDEAANKCADDQQLESFRWELQSNDTKLALIDSNPDVYDLQATSIQMKITLTKPNSSGTPVTYISTYKNIK